jgi:hypothetical protein
MAAGLKVDFGTSASFFLKFSCSATVCKIHIYLSMRTLRRVLLTIVVILLTASSLVASVRVRVDEIGIKGWTSHSVTPLRFTIINDGPLVALKLRIKSDHNGTYNVPHDTYDEVLRIPSGETQFLRPLVFAAWTGVAVELSDDAGNLIASGNSQHLVRSAIRGQLVVVYSHDESVFAEVKREAIQSDDVQIKTRKERELDFVSVGDLEDKPWYYADARAIVIAEPLQASALQKRALEDYVRGGGLLVVTTSAAASTGFDAAYFREDQPVRMGRGATCEVSSFASKAFVAATTSTFVGRQRPETVLPMVAWRMKFPTMKSALVTTVLYILVIGVINFTILRRIGRLEFGWITIPAIALVFALGAYIFSLSRGVDKVRVDDVATYFMDSHSSRAFVYDGVRVTAPAYGEFVLQLAPSANFASRPEDWGGRNYLIGEAVTGRDQFFAKSWHFTRYDDTASVDLSLMRWSYEEWFSDRFEDRRGTVRLDGTTIRNLTGVKFKSAIVLDRLGQRVYNLGSLAGNAAADLGSVGTLTLPVHSDLSGRTNRSQEISIQDLARQAIGDKAFVGLAEEGQDESNSPGIRGQSSKQVHTRVYVVVLE